MLVFFSVSNLFYFCMMSFNDSIICFHLPVIQCLLRLMDVKNAKTILIYHLLILLASLLQQRKIIKSAPHQKKCCSLEIFEVMYSNVRRGLPFLRSIQGSVIDCISFIRLTLPSLIYLHAFMYIISVSNQTVLFYYLNC